MEALPGIMSGASGITGHWQFIAMMVVLVMSGIAGMVKWLITRSDKKEAERTAERKKKRDAELTTIKRDIKKLKDADRRLSEEVRTLQDNMLKMSAEK